MRSFILVTTLAGAAVACASGENTTTETTTSPTIALDAGTTPSTSPGVFESPTGDPAEADAGAAKDGATAPDTAPPPPTVTVTTESITVRGTPRSYVLVVPQTYSAARAYPLVLGLHGDGGDGAGFRSELHFDDASGQDAIVAYPTGTALSWNLYQQVDADDDVAFLVALVGALKTRFHVSDAYGIGMSSGAFMLNQMACREPTLFRGIVSHSGGVPAEPNDSHSSWAGNDNWVRCNGQNSGVAAMMIHGTADTTVPYPSGTNDASYWATVNGCTAGTTPSSPSPCTKRDSCPSDKPVVFCSIDGLGHALWNQAAAAGWTFISSLTKT